ncbi:hypothetical protein PV325_008684, partial [Microctonus aethiopoides]
ENSAEAEGSPTSLRNQDSINYTIQEPVTVQSETSVSADNNDNSFRINGRELLFVILIIFITMLIVAPTLSKLLGMRDTLIVSIGALSHAVGRILFASAAQPSLSYAGAAVAAIGPIVAPVLRSMMSKVVPINERGKVFAILSVCDNAVPLFSGVLYSQLYNETYYTYMIHFSSGSSEQDPDNCETEESSIDVSGRDEIKSDCENA